ncbi:uncharacterized protein LOC135928367 [Gordionus sp. m RMFG-2023]|uniref:uncharacterized protein LOC135928367 n=1 Tax=Gordionus sp. m RMFG-2023 TaxID=3053472 RepID=UPI0031FC22E9
MAGRRLAAEFERFCRENEIKHILAPPYHPSSNGQAKRMVGIVKNWLRKAKYGKGEVWVSVAYYNNSRKGEEMSPSEKFLGRRTRIGLDALKSRSDKPEMERKEDNTVKFTVGQTVWARVYGERKKWQSGIGMENVGKKLSKVQFQDGKVGMRHQDQLRRGVDPEQQ